MSIDQQNPDSQELNTATPTPEQPAADPAPALEASAEPVADSAEPTTEPVEAAAETPVDTTPDVEPPTESAQAAEPATETPAPAESTDSTLQPEPPTEPIQADQAATETTASAEPATETPDSEAPLLDAAALLGADATDAPSAEDTAQTNLKALIEAVIYITEEPLTADQIAAAIDQPKESVLLTLRQLAEEYAQPGRGIFIRELAGGFKMGTKPEHHEAIRAFVKRMKPPLKLSLAALETLAVIAYKQPITAPEIMDIRGVQGAGVIKTLLDRKLIAIAGRKAVVGKPILYKTTKDFLLQFGLKDLAELPTLKEFEELRRLAFADEDTPAETTPESQPAATPEPQAAAAPTEPEEHETSASSSSPQAEAAATE